MATVEELIVKFTGDASGMDKAASKAKLDLKSVEKEVLTLNRVLERAKASGAKDDVLDYNMKALEAKVGQYLKIRDKVRREDEAGKEKGRFGQVVLAAQSRVLNDAIAGGENLAQRAIEDWTGMTKAAREYERAVYEAKITQSDMMHAISQQSRTVERDVARMKTPFGEPDELARMKRHNEALVDFEKKANDARTALAFAEKEMERNEARNPEGYKILNRGQVRQIPFVGKVEQQEFEIDQQAIDDARAKVEKFRELARNEREKLADLTHGGGPLGRMEDRLKLRNTDLVDQSRTVGMTAEQVELMKERERLQLIINAGGAKDAEALQRVNDLLWQQEAIAKEVAEKREAQRKREEKARDRETIQNRLRDDEAALGFEGAEAEVLKRHARGFDEGNREILEMADKLSGADLNKKFMDPYKKAGKEIDRLNRLHRQGNIDAQTYAKALEEVARQTDNVGRASERAGVEVGSAESMARIDEYVRIQQQPQALANQIDRAMSQPPTGSGDSEMSKQTAILEGIRRNTAKGANGVPMVPANLGGG